MVTLATKHKDEHEKPSIKVIAQVLLNGNTSSEDIIAKEQLSHITSEASVIEHTNSSEKRKNISREISYSNMGEASDESADESDIETDLDKIKPSLLSTGKDAILHHQNHPGAHLDSLLSRSVDEYHNYDAFHLVSHGELEKLKQWIDYKVCCNSEFNLATQCVDEFNSNASLLHKASSKNQLKIMEYLIDNYLIDVDHKDDLEATPLFYATASGHYDAVVMLLSKGAQVNIKDKYEQSPLFIAVKHNFQNIIKTFVEMYHADINMRSSKGLTSLHKACMMADWSLIKLLLELGASFERTDRNDEHPLYYCIHKHLLVEQIIQWLFAKDSASSDSYDMQTEPGQTYLKLLKMKNHNGNNILHYCVEKGFALSLLKCISYIPDDKLSSILNEPTKEFGFTLLHLSVLCGREDLVKFLCMGKEVDVNIQDIMGDIPLHVACRQQKESIAKLLTNPGNSNLKLKNNQHFTCLQLSKKYKVKLKKKEKKSIWDVLSNINAKLFHSHSLQHHNSHSIGLGTRSNNTSHNKLTTSYQKAEKRYTMQGLHSQEAIPSVVAFKVEWSPSYDVHYAPIDNEHHRLVDLIQKLADHTSNPYKKDWEVGYLIGQLLEYTDFHFSNEEELMEEHKYPTTFATKHKAQHREFVQKINEVHDRFLKGDAGIDFELLSFLLDWLVKHIMNIDKYLAEWIIKAVNNKH